MANKKMPFHRILTKTAASGTNTLDLEPVNSGWLECLQRFAVVDEDNACTRLRFMFISPAGEFLVSEQATPQAGELYWDDMPVYLSEGMFFRVELTGCTAGDVIRAYLTGWRLAQRTEG